MTPRTVRPRGLVTAACLSLLPAVLTVPAGTATAGPTTADPAAVDPAAAEPAAACKPGARTLSRRGDILFPETGNGGYRSEHTDVHLTYDAGANRLRPGTHVVLTLTARHCLSEFSLDFETSSPLPGGPSLRLGAVSVDGQTAAHRLARPTYPGNPKGPDDPDPRAHQAGQQNPVGGPRNNPLPPACSPSLAAKDSRHAKDGTMCPATKLVITPSEPVAAGTEFQVRIDYTGRPGLHHGADGLRDGWWATRGGSVVNTEPLGNQAWMPLNNHPSAKPTYDFWITTQLAKTVVASGELAGQRRNPPDDIFAKGSRTTHWHSPDPIASYLPTVLVGDYSVRKFRTGGVTYRLLQDAHIPQRQQRRNAVKLRLLDDSTRFLRRFNGPFPFSTDGAAVTRPGYSDMEMQTMSIFAQGALDVSTLYHENMHQWWGDAVTQRGYRMVYFKEGLATFSELLRRARLHGGPVGSRGFNRSLARQFSRVYRREGNFWHRAPSRPRPWDYFAGPGTYVRPGAAYAALYLTLGHRRFTAVLRQVQREHGGGTVSRRQLETAFVSRLRPGRCQARGHRFFHQWFDVGYPHQGRKRPGITGPGLPGSGIPVNCRR